MTKQDFETRVLIALAELQKGQAETQTALARLEEGQAGIKEDISTLQMNMLHAFKHLSETFDHEERITKIENRLGMLANHG